MGAGPCEKLRLLMWKNFLQQWRHKLQSLAEVLLPVLTASLVVILRVEVEPAEYPGTSYPPIPAYSLNFSRTILTSMDVNNISLAYSPTSAVLDTTIRTAILRILYENIESFFPVESTRNDLVEELLSLINLTAYEDSGQLEDIYLQTDSTKRVLAAVEFDDSLRGATELPDNISYALRFPSRPRLNSFFGQGGWSWRTDLLFPAFATPGPRFRWSWEGGNNPGYVNEMFIALQHAISTELIRAKAPDAAVLPVHIQRFPHPPYTVDQLINILQFLFPMFVMMSFTYTAVSTVRFVAREKELQLKESMKIMGLPTWLHWTAWFLKQFSFLLITITIVVIILKMEWYSTEQGLSGYSIFTMTPWTVIFVFLALYIACTIFFCFMISGLFAKASTAALFCSVFWFLSYLPSLFLSTENGASFAAKISSCLSVNSAMALGFQQMLAMEGTNRGMQWSDFFTPLSADDDFLFGYVWIMLLLDCVLYMLIALYFEKVFPGSFGVPQPWYYPVKLSYWFPSRFDEAKNYTPSDASETVVTEKDPVGHAVGVEIQNLTKIFNGQAAVDSLNLNIYDDQISVLLGHNGAGKTTTISMLTGMIPPSSGTAFLAGHNIRSHMDDARSSLGICPQHNVLFADLTVREHLLFFSRLKGLKGDKLKSDVDNIIDKLELSHKADTVAGSLSGGQQRRLCVGVALCGSPRVVLLDEPTSGMDPASRRALWDLLQKEKKGRAMILTTHFMDEADILGDRVAIMAKGILQCVGSPFFLKQQFGDGYKLVIVKEQACQIAACTELLQSHIPEVQLHSVRGSELFYGLPNEQSHKFQIMLQDLECNHSKIGIKSYGLTPSTLEDVFMKVGSDTYAIEDEPEDDNVTLEADLVSNGTPTKSELEGSSTEYLYQSDLKVTGLKLLWNHIFAMWLKRTLSVWRDWKISLLQIIIPVFIMLISLLVVQYTSTYSSQFPQRNLMISEGYINTETLVSHNDTLPASSPSQLALGAYVALFDNPGETNMTMSYIGNESVQDHYLEKGSVQSEMARMRYRNVIGATFAPESVTAWFSNFGFHDVAVTLSTMHNALLRAYAPNATIRVANHPLPVTTDDETNLEILNSILAMQLANSIGTSMAIITSFFVIFYIKERVSRAKLLQKSSGIQPIVMWGAAALFDWLWFLVICLGVILTFVVLQVQGFSSFEQLGRGFVIFMVFGASMLPVHYLASFCFSGTASGFVLAYFINTFLGTIGSMIVDALKTPGLTTQDMAVAFDMVLQFFPTYAMVNSFRHLTTVGLTEATCAQLCDAFSESLQIGDCTMHTICQAGVNLCCMEDNPHFLWDSPGVLKYLVYMLVSCVAFWAILLTIEYRLLYKAFNFRRSVPPLLDLSTEDSDVADETIHVQNVDPTKLPQYNLVCRDITKFYGKHLAVNQVSFSVNSGECFGLLGVNGAGKTTTFKMLTGDITISSGDAFVRGHSVKNNIKRVHEHIGYCPQFDALFDELTGRETLRLYALLRGLRTEHAAELTLDLAKRLNFVRHIDKPVRVFSGGNKRKLSTAIALMGYAGLIYLDEPTTGVDPAAKRQVWRVIHHVNTTGRSVVLTSHSMEECEALCSRLAIMVNGRFRCFGSLQHLKNKFSQGYILTVKLKAEDDIAAEDLAMSGLKNYIVENFTDAKLMECYQGLLTYYLPDTSAAWSHMFGLMEEAKRQHDIEDYTISQTTLEQVFLQFTKHQQESHRADD